VPTRDPKLPQKLSPPITRVTNQWAHLWRVVARDNPKRYARARAYSTAIRRHK
jgi:hypothetical protein